MFKTENLKNVASSVISLLILFQVMGFCVAQSHAAQNPDLKLRLESKQKHNFRIVSDDTISHTVMGQKQDIHYSRTTVLSFEVEQVESDSAAWLKITYLAYKEKGKSAVGQMEYDSTKPDVATDNPMAPTYSAMIGQNFMAKVTSEGKVVEIKGIDEMYRRMAERIVESEDALRKKRLKEKAQRATERANRQYGSREKRIDAVKKMIESNPLLSEEKITEAAGHVIIPLPGRVVVKGDSWQGQRTLPGIPAKVNCTYVLKETDQAITTVDIRSEFDFVDVPVPSKVGSSGSTKVSIAGSYQGAAQIDRACGWLIRKKVALKASGQTKMAPNRQASQGTTMPMSIESVINVEPMK